MKAHEELRNLIDDFFTSVLLRKPRNLHKYVADYFSELLKQQRGIILCGPNGAGKHSIVKKILSEFPKAFQIATKHTTKVPNSTDQNLIFISTDKMSEMHEEGKFLRVEEDREGNRYGIAKQTFDNITKDGKICLIETDVKGSKEYNKCKKFEQKPFYIFIKPPSPEVLEERLQKRGESEEIIQKTMNELTADLDFADHGFYDLVYICPYIIIVIDTCE